MYIRDWNNFSSLCKDIAIKQTSYIKNNWGLHTEAHYSYKHACNSQYKHTQGNNHNVITNLQI